MAFKQFPGDDQSVRLLQRSLERGRLAHGYLWSGHHLEILEDLARTLAKVLNCRAPVRAVNGVPIDSCDTCLNCQKIDHGNHADVHWVRPESKTRIITVEQMRDLMKQIQLKPNEAEFKVAVIVAADRLRTEAANAFLKTLEEPPAKSVLVLLTTEPQRLLDTIRSRCVRMNFAATGLIQIAPALRDWLKTFAELAAIESKSLLSRYRLMDILLKKLTELKEETETALKDRSPLERYKDAEKNLRDKWEDELSAAVEAEYRRQRTELLSTIQLWLRDVWYESMLSGGKETSPVSPLAKGHTHVELLSFPELEGTRRVAKRIQAKQAAENLDVMEQLQSWLSTNVQEALALEVGMLRLHL